MRFFKDKDNERGSVVVLIAVMLVLLLGLPALVVDLGMLMNVRSELQNAADAGALAGVVDLVYIGEDVARQTATTYTTEGRNFKLTKPAPQADAVEVTPLGPETLQVRVRRSQGTSSGPVSTFFARIWGTDTADVAAIAVATTNYQIIGTGPGNLMPFAVLKDWFDQDGDGNFDLGREFDIYPHSWTPGNFGILDLNGAANSNDDIDRWIEQGYDGTFIIPESTGFIDMEGDPGISGNSLDPALNYRESLGQPVLFPVFETAWEQGATTVFRVVGLVGGIIISHQFVGAASDRHFRVLLTKFSNGGVIVGRSPTTPFNNSVSRPILIR